MKTLAVVVFYNPEGDYVSRCSLISKQVDKLVIYDNSTDHVIIEKNKSDVSNIPNVSYYSEGINKGIGAALNYAAIEAEKGNFDFLLTFDQDTLIPEDYVERIISSYLSEKNIGVIGPVYKDINVSRECRFPVKAGPFILRKRLSGGSKLQDVMVIISSGSLYPVSVFKVAGYFEEDYFIDYIDNEYCLRLIKFGYRVCVDPKIIINHALGNRTVNKAILKFSPTNYPFYRKYYMTRNRLIVYKKYFFGFFSFVVYDFAAFLLDIFRVFLIENDKKRKFSAYWLGFKDFINGRRGAMGD